MQNFAWHLCALIILSVPTSVAAQDIAAHEVAPQQAPAPAKDPAIKVTGGATLISDYRVRGLSQTGGEAAFQATITANLASGFYVGAWGSTIDGRINGKAPALAGFGPAEIDLYAGYSKSLTHRVTVDVGTTYYYYPDHVKGLNTDFFEPYASVSYKLGPATAKMYAAYAWGGQAGLRGLNPRGGNDDNLYVWAEAALAVPKTPITVRARYGWSRGSLGAANGNDDDDYADWSLTAEAAAGPLTVGARYVDTDIRNTDGFARRMARGATVLGYVGVGF